MFLPFILMTAPFPSTPFHNPPPPSPYYPPACDNSTLFLSKIPLVHLITDASLFITATIFCPPANSLYPPAYLSYLFLATVTSTNDWCNQDQPYPVNNIQ